MTKITDVFAFATKNADYWTELLSGANDYPQELTEDEVAACESAREHIEDVVVDLLHEAGGQTATLLSWNKPRFKGASTKKNRSVAVYPPPNLQDRIYRVEILLDEHPEGDVIVLYATVVAKKAHHDQFLGNLSDKNISYTVDGYAICADPMTLDEGLEVADLARRVAERARDLVNAL